MTSRTTKLISLVMAAFGKSLRAKPQNQIHTSGIQPVSTVPLPGFYSLDSEIRITHIIHFQSTPNCVIAIRAYSGIFAISNSFYLNYHTSRKSKFGNYDAQLLEMLVSTPVVSGPETHEEVETGGIPLMANVTSYTRGS